MKARAWSNNLKSTFKQFDKPGPADYGRIKHGGSKARDPAGSSGGANSTSRTETQSCAQRALRTDVRVYTHHEQNRPIALKAALISPEKHMAKEPETNPRGLR